MRARAIWRCLLGLGLGVALLLPGVASSADGPTIEATSNFPYAWNPSTASISPGGAVNFKNSSGVVGHGVTWTGGPGKPSCTQVPIDEAKTNWSGSCTFANAGIYTFVCTVHPTEMKGSITAGSGGPAPNPNQPGSPASGAVAKDLKIAKTQRGGRVRGSIEVQAGAGGRLEVELLGARALLLGPGRAGKMRVGRTVRSSLPSARVAFVVPLKPVARRAVEERGRLSLKVRLKIDPPSGPTLALSRSVTVRG